MNTPKKDKKIKIAAAVFNSLTVFMMGVLVTLLFLW
jgi:hypothetical protein